MAFGEVLRSRVGISDVAEYQMGKCGAILGLVPLLANFSRIFTTAKF
jgi:hypothetical protein